MNDSEISGARLRRWWNRSWLRYLIAAVVVGVAGLAAFLQNIKTIEDRFRTPTAVVAAERLPETPNASDILPPQRWRFKPTSSDVTLQQLVVNLPTDVKAIAVRVRSPDFTADLAPLASLLGRVVQRERKRTDSNAGKSQPVAASSLPKPSPEISTDPDEATSDAIRGILSVFASKSYSMPIFVEIDFVQDRTRHVASALYQLDYETWPFNPPSVQVVGIRFIRHLGPRENPQAVIDGEFAAKR